VTFSNFTNYKNGNNNSTYSFYNNGFSVNAAYGVE
jgi:hypothetical protein